jgi:phosphohistidine phosphatase
LLLVLVRHGEAESKSARKSDDERGLTIAGSERLNHNLTLAKEIAGKNPDLIISSPILRARQSAVIAQHIFGNPKIEIDVSLMSESTPYEVFQSLSKHDKAGCLMLVSHQPLMSRLLSSILNWSDQYFSFKAGTIALVDVKEIKLNPNGVLLALLPPSNAE